MLISIEYTVDPECQSAAKWVKKCAKYVHKFIYIPRDSGFRRRVNEIYTLLGFYSA
jgi:hypothetical protein